MAQSPEFPLWFGVDGRDRQSFRRAVCCFCGCQRGSSAAAIPWPGGRDHQITKPSILVHKLSCLREPADLRQKHPIHQSRSQSFPSIHATSIAIAAPLPSLSLLLHSIHLAAYKLTYTFDSFTILVAYLCLTIAIAATTGELTYSINPHPTVGLFISGLDSRVSLPYTPTDRAPPSYFRTAAGSGDHLSTLPRLQSSQAIPIPSSPKHQPLPSSPLSHFAIDFNPTLCDSDSDFRRRLRLHLCAFRIATSVSCRPVARYSTLTQSVPSRPRSRITTIIA